MMMPICIKQHLRDFWSSIHEKVKEHWGWVETWKKSVAYKKACSCSWKEGEPPLAHPYGSNPDKAYSEPSETSKMKLFAKIVNSSIVGTWLGSLWRW